MVYINLKENNKIETIDEFETIAEARKMLKEYRLTNSYYCSAYISQKCTKEWRNR